MTLCVRARTWLLSVRVWQGKPSVLGMLSGAIAGLVVVTPGSGYMDQVRVYLPPCLPA